MILIVVGAAMIYPLFWLFFATFKDNKELFEDDPASGALLFGIQRRLEGKRTIFYLTFYLNTFKLVIPTVALTAISTGIVAYGFARFKFPMKKLLFMLMISH